MSDDDNGTHLHMDNAPEALGILRALFDHRLDRAAEIGYRPTEHGAFVNWDRLEHSWLSSTEEAAVIVARGLAAAEPHGGWPPHIQDVIIGAVTRTPDRGRRRPGE